MEFTYWYLFPIAIVIATVANGAGIGGATFFAPLFILALHLEPRVAIGAALTTEVFGFASGVIAHTRARTIDWGEWLELKEQLAYRIKQIVEEAGTGFAFPSQSLYVETLPEENPEIFVPPET